jgi:hypothetical protein
VDLLTAERLRAMAPGSHIGAGLTSA